MNIKQALASVALTGTLALAIPAAPAFADGAASTRNLILLGGAATYLIIQHNRKVHEHYAEYARRQAALSQENNDAWSAYHQEQRAYEQEVQVNSELKKEIAYQHGVVDQQRHQLGLGRRPRELREATRWSEHRLAHVERPQTPGAASCHGVVRMGRYLAVAALAALAACNAQAAARQRVRRIR